MVSSDKEKALILYRMESAKEKLKAAVDLLGNSDYKDSVSRSYYAIFTAARALLATKQLDSAKTLRCNCAFQPALCKNKHRSQRDEQVNRKGKTL